MGWGELRVEGQMRQWLGEWVWSHTCWIISAPLTISTLVTSPPRMRQALVDSQGSDAELVFVAWVSEMCHTGQKGER